MSQLESIFFRNRVLLRDAERGEGADDLDGFEAYRDDLADEAEDVLLVVGAVGIVGDAAALVG
jgi:hypothetical protein